jgi:hypothetical protein
MATEEVRKNILKSILEVAEIALEAKEPDLAAVLVQIIALAEFRREMLGLAALTGAVVVASQMGFPGPRAPIIAEADALLERINVEWRKES